MAVRVGVDLAGVHFHFLRDLRSSDQPVLDIKTGCPVSSAQA